MFDRTKDSLLFDLRRIRRNILDEFMVRSHNLGFELSKLVDSESKLVRTAADRGRDVLRNIRKSVWDFYKVRYDRQDLDDWATFRGSIKAKEAELIYEQEGIRTTFFQGASAEDYDNFQGCSVLPTSAKHRDTVWTKKGFLLEDIPEEGAGGYNTRGAFLDMLRNPSAFVGHVGVGSQFASTEVEADDEAKDGGRES